MDVIFLCVALFVIYIGRRGSNMQCGEFSISMWRTIQIGGDLFVRQMALLLHVSAYYVILAMQKLSRQYISVFFFLFFGMKKMRDCCIFAHLQNLLIYVKLHFSMCRSLLVSNQ